MAKKVGVELVISAVDEVTYKVMAINDKLKKFTEPLEKLNTAFGDLSRESGLSKVGERLSNVNQKFSAFTGEAAKGLGIMAGLGYGFYRLVKGSSDFAGNLKDTSDRLGVGLGQLQAWNYAAVMTGGSAENVEKSLNKMGQAIQNAADNEGEAVGIFRGFGISLRDKTGQIRKLQDILPEFAEQFSKIKSPITQNAIAMRVFGKEGVKFAQILKGGKAGLDEFYKSAAANGAILSDKDLMSLDSFGDRFDQLTQQFEVFKAQAIATIMPQLINLLDTASGWMKENQGNVAAWAAEFGKNLPAYIEVVKNILLAVTAIVGALAKAFSWLSGMIGQNNAAFVALGLTVFRGTIIAFAQLAGSLISLGATVFPMLLTGIGTLASALGTLATTIFAIPFIGWIALAITAIGALTYAIYKNWEPIKDFVKNLWDGIISTMTSAMEKIGGIISKVKGFFGFGDSSIAVNANALPMGASGAPVGGVAAAQNVRGQLSRQTNESIVKIDFGNAPKGMRTEVEKSDVPLDLSMGYGMVN